MLLILTCLLNYWLESYSLDSWFYVFPTSSQLNAATLIRYFSKSHSVGLYKEKLNKESTVLTHKKLILYHL